MTVYDALAPWIPEAVAGPFWATYFSAAPLAGARFRIAALRGRTPAGEPLSILLASRSDWPSVYLNRRLFGGNAEAERIQEAFVYSLKRNLARHASGFDMIWVHAGAPLAAYLSGNGALRLPALIHTRIPVESAALSHPAETLRSDLRRLAASGFQPEMSHREGDIDLFYDRFLLPTVTERHGEEAQPMSRGEAHRYFRGGGVLWVRGEDGLVAGALIRRRGRDLEVRAVGIADGDPAHFRSGAMTGCYRFLLEEAKRLGCAALDMRGSRPSLRDGVLRFKQKWGGEIAYRPDLAPEEFCVNWSQPTNGVAAALDAYEPVFRFDGGLASATSKSVRTCDTANPVPAQAGSDCWSSPAEAVQALRSQQASRK